VRCIGFLQEYGILKEVKARALKHALATVAGLTPDLPKNPPLSTSLKRTDALTLA
jgi:hypothetical protein